MNPSPPSTKDLQARKSRPPESHRAGLVLAASLEVESGVARALVDFICEAQAGGFGKIWSLWARGGGMRGSCLLPQDVLVRFCVVPPFVLYLSCSRCVRCFALLSQHPQILAEWRGSLSFCWTAHLTGVSAQEQCKSGRLSRLAMCYFSLMILMILTRSQLQPAFGGRQLGVWMKIRHGFAHDGYEHCRIRVVLRHHSYRFPIVCASIKLDVCSRVDLLLAFCGSKTACLGLVHFVFCKW